MQKMQNSCKWCEILADPIKKCSCVYKEDERYLICVLIGEPKTLYCIYQKHGEHPGGHIINLMIDELLKLQDLKYNAVYGDHKHFYVKAKRRAE